MVTLGSVPMPRSRSLSVSSVQLPDAVSHRVICSGFLPIRCAKLFLVSPSADASRENSDKTTLCSRLRSRCRKYASFAGGITSPPTMSDKNELRDVVMWIFPRVWRIGREQVPPDGPTLDDCLSPLSRSWSPKLLPCSP